MQRMSIARSLRLALVSLAVALAVVAALGVASLYRARQRYEVVLVAVAGALALVAALVLISLLVRAMRRPLDELLEATRALAGGDLRRRVRPSGPRELRELGAAFNAMGEDLLGAQRQIEEQRN